jgi:hypothetical protein
MGLSSIDMPHLAIGGMPDLPSADLSKSSAFNDRGAGTGPLHPVTLNLPGGGSIDGFHAQGQ